MTGITYGIIISIENYNESTDFPKVDFASKDAQDFTEALLELGYNEDDFLILSNEKATKTAILSKVKKFVTRGRLRKKNRMKKLSRISSL